MWQAYLKGSVHGKSGISTWVRSPQWSFVQDKMLEVGGDVGAMRRMKQTSTIRMLPWNEREAELKAEVEGLRQHVIPGRADCSAIYCKLMATGKHIHPSDALFSPTSHQPGGPVGRQRLYLHTEKLNIHQS